MYMDHLYMPRQHIWWALLSISIFSHMQGCNAT